jgi:FlaA1/EpsC-like NDP-sugar epimerase
MPLSKPAAVLVSFPRGIKKLIVLLLDVMLCFLTAWLAFCLRYDDIVAFSGAVALVGAVSAVVVLPIFISQGLYRAIFRYSGWFATLSLIKAVSIYSIGFVDDDSRLWRGLINGLPVYSHAEVPQLVGSKGVTDILLAMPAIGRARQKEILTTLSDLPVHVRTLPGLSALANGVVKIEDIREVEIQDVLGRDAIQANEDLLHQKITGKVVLVTGAGGSIGSELCRQILV